MAEARQHGGAIVSPAAACTTGPPAPKRLELRDKEIFLIGGGNSAGQAAMFFSNYARRVTLLVRGASLEKSMSYYLIEQLRTKDNIAVETGSTVIASRATRTSKRSPCENEATGSASERRADAIFVVHRRRRGNGVASRSSSSATSSASSSPAATYAGGPLTRPAFHSRRACRAFSPPATCAAIPSSASRRASVRAAWSSPSFTST